MSFSKLKTLSPLFAEIPAVAGDVAIPEQEPAIKIKKAPRFKVFIEKTKKKPSIVRKGCQEF